MVLIIATLLGPLAHAQVCGELFRATPALEGVLNRPWVGMFGGPATGMDAPGPNQTRVLRAVQSDVLGLHGFSSRTIYSIKRTFALIGLSKAGDEVATVEFHRRRYERELEKMGLPPSRDLRTRLRENKHYLSMLFSVAANGAVNYLSYHYLNTFGYLVHIPQTRIFNERELPDDVLNELIDAKVSDDVPKTRAYVNARIKFGADEVIAAGRRMFNYGILAVVLITHGDMITDPVGHSMRMLQSTTSQIHDAAQIQNDQTLQLLNEKRAKFLAAGEMEKVAKADALILEVKQQRTSFVGQRN